MGLQGIGPRLPSHTHEQACETELTVLIEADLVAG